jgi:uncharacterized protein
VRLAIISDTHMPKGSRTLPEACVARLREADLILHAGDLVRTEVLDALEALGPPVHAISGNVDDDAVRERVPPTRVVEAGGTRIGMVHDGGRREGRLARLRDRFRDADAVVFGHSHLPEHLTDERTGFQVFNPGSPTERRRAPTRTMGIAEAADGRVAFELVDLGVA